MKDSLKRSFIIFMVVLFAVTSIGIGVLSFWMASRSDDTNLTQQDQAQDECAISSVQGVETLPVPEAFKPEGDVNELKTEDLQAGNGQAAKAGDCLTVKYHGTLAASGEKFDGNFDKPEGLKLIIGQGQVIPGWDQGLIGLKEGGTRRLVVPSQLAYGDQSAGAIPANSDLVFVVKLVSIE